MLLVRPSMFVFVHETFVVRRFPIGRGPDDPFRKTIIVTLRLKKYKPSERASCPPVAEGLTDFGSRRGRRRFSFICFHFSTPAPNENRKTLPPICGRRHVARTLRRSRGHGFFFFLRTIFVIIITPPVEIPTTTLLLFGFRFRARKRGGKNFYRGYRSKLVANQLAIFGRTRRAGRRFIVGRFY